MRNNFAEVVEKIGRKNKKAIFLTGDLGFMALEGVRKGFGKRFINSGVSEQNMISVAAALASQGLEPTCYSIAPFTVFRPAEQIRLDVCLHNLNVKIIGNGGGYGYGIMGGTHHAIEDIAVLSSFQNMRCYIPFCSQDATTVTKEMYSYRGPGYLRLAKGKMPEGFVLPAYSQIRQLLKGKKLTVVAMGPLTIDAYLTAADFPEEKAFDLFVVSEIPVVKLSSELVKSIKKTGNVLVVEDHVARGGLAEHLSLLISKLGLNARIEHLCAMGYPDGLYGSQEYHHLVNGLEKQAISKTITKLIRNKK